MKLFRWIGLLLITVVATCVAEARVRIKDIANVGGHRDVELVGYGLVTGLDGTGDKAGTRPTAQSLGSMLRKMGINLPPESLTSNNVAAVAITARMPVYGSVGGHVDATVSSIGNATSLEGGTLLLSPLMSNDGSVVASAQGQIQTEREFGKREKRKAVLTVGNIPDGVSLEQGFSAQVVFEDNSILVRLHQPDFVTAERAMEAIKSAFNTVCSAVDPVSIRVQVPEEFKSDPVGFIARIESLSIDPDEVARVVINEKTGTVVSGKDVRISAVSISHGELEVKVSGGSVLLPDSSTVTTLVSMLTTMGATTGDIALIFKTLKKAGALNADLVIM